MHKDTIAVALPEAGVRGDVREYGKVANTPAAMKALAANLSRVGSVLRFCYEVCFDRETGQPIPAGRLKTYAQALLRLPRAPGVRNSRTAISMIADQHVAGTFGHFGSNTSARSRTAGKSNITLASTKVRTLPTALTRARPVATCLNSNRLSESLGSASSRARLVFRATPCDEFSAAKIDRRRDASFGRLPRRRMR